MRLLTLFAPALAVPSVLFAARTIEVSPHGGSLAEAVSRVRAARVAGEADVFTVQIGKGVHALTQPLVLTAEDHDIVFDGDGGAILSGGVRLGPWRQVAKGVWEAEAPRHRSGGTGFFDQLWVRGRRAPCARIPDVGHLHAREMSQVSAGTDSNGVRQFETRVSFTNDLVDALAHIPSDELQYVQMGVIHKWCYGKRPLKTFDASSRTTHDVSCDGFESWKQWGWETMFHFENARAGFDAPGEWFLDMKAGKVLYRPLPGEDPNRIEIVAPVPGLSSLVVVRGCPDAGEFSRNVVFRGISFAYTASTPPASGANGPAVLVQHQAAGSMDGAIDLTGAHGYAFEDCRIAHTGNYGMKFRDGCMSNRIVRCRLGDLGAGGIWMGAAKGWSDRSGGISRRVMRPESPVATAFNLIEDTLIVRGGRYNPEGTGIALTHCSDTCVRHCDIHDFYYTGISVGLTWGYGGSVAQRNEIAYNLIYDLGKGLMSDMGGVNTLGTSFGTTIHDNVIHDVCSYDYGGWGLYADEGSEGIVMERNLCWNTTDGGFHQHYGSGCVIRNNIFAWNRIRGAVRTSRSLVDGVPSSLHFIDNIVVVKEGPLAGEGVSNVDGVWTGNLWWDERGEDAATFDGMKWRDWNKTDKGRGSLFADPGFSNPGAGDFRLKTGSPALGLGFRPWEYSRAGLSRGK